MASAGTYKQDLPPKGGYAPINFKRIPARSVLNAPIIFGGLIGTTALGAWIYKRGIRQWQILDIEMKSASLALTPLMLAERDRAYLKQLRKNRDAEEKLMGGVEGWEVGTFYGHKVYKTLKPDELPMVGFDEFYIHTNRAQQNKARCQVQWFKFD